MKHAIILATLLLPLAACQKSDNAQEVVITAHAGDDVNEMTRDVLRRAGGPVRVRVVYADDFYRASNDTAYQRPGPVKFADVLVSYNDKIGDHAVSLYGGPQKFDNGVTVQVYEDGVVRVMIDRFRQSEVDSAYNAGLRHGRAIGAARWDTVYAGPHPVTQTESNPNERTER